MATIPTRRLPALGATASTAWSVWALLLGMGMLMLGNGMQGTLLGLRASDEGFTATVTGLVMAGYFAGFLGGALLTPSIIQRAGHVRVFAALASLASVAILVHAVFVTPPVWGAMRILTGFAYSGLYIVTESWLNDHASNEVRGRLLSVYLVITFIGMGGGQLTMNLASPGDYDLFLLNAIVLSLALIPTMAMNTAPLAYSVLTDNGPGIRDAEQIFEKFSRDRETSGKHGGTGLGRAISRRIIQKMRGDLHIVDNDGQGTRFRIRLLLAEGA